MKTSEEKGKNAKKKPFKQTKILMKLALDDGWTQKEIADKCRSHQSVVSSWRKGVKNATEEQLKPLLELFGHKLRRNSFRVYWSIDPETNEKTFLKVEGKVIMSEAFCDARRNGPRLIKKIPKYKLVIHYQGGNEFRVVNQTRLTFKVTNEELESSQEDAVWGSEISDRLSIPALLELVDNFAEQKLSDYPSDAYTLPYIARKALLNHGFPLVGIVEYPAVW